ncbi:hypothetical protein B0H17DRAFT_1089117 [Mycena rosella]|uniref:G-protein coupled receptors family 2 profile 2 domain-containing protein n=1 Tax=Mycena rosella TaxID=1033263 RepID=A0AAD7CW79_MYCRO|nr:hypothetical protein B0H17DRAFT_1089117 [Mycena rosella]
MTLSRPHTPTVLDEHIGDLTDGLVLPGVCLIIVVLCAFAYTAWHPVSRPYLNRVSFRLLCFGLVGNLLFGIAWFIDMKFSGPSAGCGFVICAIDFSILFSGGIFFCMALNLELVLVHQIQGKTMEKYYILGTFILSALCSVVPYASGKFGWDEFNQGCWFSAPDERTMIKWLVGTLSFWVLLMSTGEVLVFLIIVGYLISHEITIRRLRSTSADSDTDNYYAEDYTSPKSRIAMYRNTILRIGLYPLVSCLINFSTCIIDLYQVAYQDKTPILTELDWRLNIADLVIYSFRPLMYGVLAVTDPAFLRALLELRRPVEMHSMEQSMAVHFATITDVAGTQWNPTEHHLGGSAQPVALEAMETDQSSPADSLKEPARRRSMGGLYTRRGSAVVDLASQI